MGEVEAWGGGQRAPAPRVRHSCSVRTGKAGLRGDLTLAQGTVWGGQGGRGAAGGVTLPLSVMRGLLGYVVCLGCAGCMVGE